MSQVILNELLKGNRRFMQGNNIYPRINTIRMEEVLNSQQPKSVIIGCADSRVPPEIIFDQGLGDLFVLRVAGNIMSNAILESIYYAIEYLQVSLILILGHSNCGAVQAIIDNDHTKSHLFFSTLSKAITPAVEKAYTMNGDLLENATKENIKLVAKKLINHDHIIQKHMKDKNLQVVPAYYHLHNGFVELI